MTRSNNQHFWFDTSCYVTMPNMNTGTVIQEIHFKKEFSASGGKGVRTAMYLLAHNLREVIETQLGLPHRQVECLSNVDP